MKKTRGWFARLLFSRKPAFKSGFDLEMQKVPSDEILEQAIRNVFRTRSGELFMLWMERECSFWDSTFVPGNPDVTLMNEAKRELLLDIKRIVVQEDENWTDSNEGEDHGRRRNDPDRSGPVHDTEPDRGAARSDGPGITVGSDY